jgi:4-hydroxy-3-methylbut-2-enyl diphosphate reductase
MQIILARTAGFCMGVKRAMQLAQQTAKALSEKVYTCGPLIHNPQAVEFLHENGVESLTDWHVIKKGTIIIRAHGMPKQEIAEMKALGLGIVDATCPHVVTSQKKIKKYYDEGYMIVITGDKSHPEILSLQSFATDNCRVISSLEEAKELRTDQKIMVIAQTTFNARQFAEIAKVFDKGQNVICNSICQATSERQEEIQKLATYVDAVVVVGGKASANTRRLAEIAAEYCNRTYHIETEKELEKINFHNVTRVAVTAGASTPDFITQRVIDFLKSRA